MKTVKLLFGILLVSVLTTSCYTEVVVDDDHVIDPPGMTLGQLLTSYDLWYVNIDQTTGYGEVPFLQKAFTITFDYGVLMANNNLAGIGKTGNGYGIDVGYYSTSGTTVRIDHDADGIWNLEVYQLSGNRIRIYDRGSSTSYYLTGYQRNEFDYNYVFYDNIRYYLQEYQAWEKIYTSDQGTVNLFDEENFLKFLAGGNDDTFRSSTDQFGTNIGSVYWDYEGIYTIYNVQGNAMKKVLTLDYDSLDNEYFELTVINENTIELYHPFIQKRCIDLEVLGTFSISEIVKRKKE